MDSPIAWLGGKSRLAARIVELLPSHAHYGEPFAGAGWVFFRKAPSKSESLNDINSDLAAFYRVLQHHLEEFCKQFKWLLASRETFEDFKRQLQAGGLTDIQRAARFYYLQRCCFGGRVQGRTFGIQPEGPPRINLVRMEEELSQAYLRLAGVTVENLKWEEYLARYDRPGTLFYVDPPYHGSEGDYGKGLFARSDFARLAEALAAIQGKFILSINDVPEIRETFWAFRILEVETTYSCARDTPRSAAELLVMNFEARPGLLGLC